MGDAYISGLSIDISHMKYVSSAPTVHQIIDHFFTKTALYQVWWCLCLHLGGRGRKIIEVNLEDYTMIGGSV